MRMPRIFVRMRGGPDVNWDIFDVCQGGSHPFAHHSVLCQQPGFEIGSPTADRLAFSWARCQKVPTIDIERKVKYDDGSDYFSTASLSPECCIVTYSLTRSFTEFSSFLKFT